MTPDHLASANAASSVADPERAGAGLGAAKDKTVGVDEAR